MTTSLKPKSRYLRAWEADFQHRQFDEKLKSLKAQQAGLRRDNERFSLRVEQLGLTWDRERRQRTGESITFSEARRRMRLALHAGQIVIDPLVAGYQEHLHRLCGQLKIAATFDALPVNAYAWSSLRRVELAPILTGEDYAVALHEIGHVERPCQSSHTRRPTDSKKTVCVRCEIHAWEWAIAQARPTWTRDMLDEMAVALASYRKYATPAEEREIAVLSSPDTINHARIARLERLIAETRTYEHERRNRHR